MFTATWDYTLNFTFINFFFNNIAPKSLTVTWLTLVLIFQKSTSQVSGELAQLKEEMAASKANFEKKVKDLEASLAKAASENSELKQSLEKQDKDWETRLATAEKKLGESEENLRGVTSRIELMVKAIWGTFIPTNPFINSSFYA